VERSLKRQFCFALGIIHFGFYCCSANGIAIPYFKKLQSDGESGRKKIRLHVG
jgi:hypothetical protein